MKQGSSKLKYILLFAAVSGSLGGLSCTTASLHRETATRKIASTPHISPEELNAAVSERRLRVPEFHWLSEWGKRKGVRVWAAGGTAAGIATYVKSDIVEGGSHDYNYYRIYRATQDADIIIDADEKVAQELEKELQSRFHYLQGNKSVWEVRLLTKSRGEGAGRKDPVIGNPNFRDQHSDSLSTGMVELTSPPHGESVMRDLFDWNNQTGSQFIKDVAAGTIHYYFSATHSSTSRAMQGINPPILSVLRYYTKAFQYSAEMDPGDRYIIKGIIDQFDPHSPEYSDGYVRKQIEANAKKIYLHSRNLEASYNTLHSSGLLEKLKAYTGRDSELGHLLKRVPLLSQPLGHGGRTAHELFGNGPIVVTHSTRDFDAYESITRARSGEPNAFQSIDGNTGELALHGDGFYVRLGREGAKLGGLPVRFTLEPNAREGSDFIYIPEKEFLVIRNKRALKVMDERISLTPLEFLQFISSPEGQELDAGVRRRLNLEMQSDMKLMTRTELDAAQNFIDEEVRSITHPEWVLEVLFDFNLFPERKKQWMDAIMRTGSLNGNNLGDYFTKWKNYAPDLITYMLQNGDQQQLTMVFYVVLNVWPGSLQHPEWVLELAKKNTQLTDNLVNGLFKGTLGWNRQPDILRVCGREPPSAYCLRGFAESGGSFHSIHSVDCPTLLEPRRF